MAAHSDVVLVVDDDTGVRVALQRLLVRSGRGVIAAAGVREAIAAARRRDARVGVAIVDLALGDESGVALVRHLRRRHPDLDIVVFSGHADEPMRQELLALGVKDCVLKPAPLSRILSALRRASPNPQGACPDGNLS